MNLWDLKVESPVEVGTIDLMLLARDLLSEDGENPEYDRGITELVTTLLGVPMDDKSKVGILIGVKPSTLEAW